MVPLKNPAFSNSRKAQPCPGLTADLPPGPLKVGMAFLVHGLFWLSTCTCQELELEVELGKNSAPIHITHYKQEHQKWNVKTSNYRTIGKVWKKRGNLKPLIRRTHAELGQFWTESIYNLYLFSQKSSPLHASDFHLASVVKNAAAEPGV